MKRARVILADDHTLIVDALKKLLEPEFEVVGVFSEGFSLVGGAPSGNKASGVTFGVQTENWW